MTNWEPVIGLEVHTQLLTKSKLFSGSSTTYGALPNTQANIVDLGFPGVLPVLNQEAVAMAVKFGVAVNASIAERSVFERKNYFYPDLPKGYQISQLALPIVEKGTLSITLKESGHKVIGITRAHLEEDAGKSLHDVMHGMTGVDFNRSGNPLLEIVSEPDIRSAEEAYAYLKALHAIVTYIGICDGNLQEGSFRCDANISVRPKGQEKFGTRTEIKNVNSFRYVEKAINYEINRQIQILEGGGTITQETRLYDADKNETRSMRSKEEANDYRYFPDPDLLPVHVAQETVDKIKATLPELPWQKQQRFINDFGLSDYDADLLTNNRTIAAYFEAIITENVNPKLAANWILGELSAALNQASLSLAESPVSSQQLAALLKRIEDNTLSGKIAKTVFAQVFAGVGEVDEIIEQQGLRQVTDTAAIEKIIDEVIANSPKQLEQYKSGKDKLFGYFVGQVMKATQGKANPAQVNALLKTKLTQ